MSDPISARRPRRPFATARERPAATGEILSDLDDHRTRREERSTDVGPVEAAKAVAVLVRALQGAIDETWLREFVAANAVALRALAPPAWPEPAAGSSESGSHEHVKVEGLHMDLTELWVSLFGRVIELTRQEFLLLRTFMQNPRRVLSREQILEQAWSYPDWGMGRTVDVHVRRLRVKLGPDAPQIVTVRGFGYRFEPRPSGPGAVAGRQRAATIR